jgi:TonB-linked SusC/RagA family outer membrane protein
MYILYKFKKMVSFGISRKSFLTILTFSMMIFNNFNQTIAQNTKKSDMIEGVISDENGEAIIGATVLSKISRKGAVADNNGKFSIPFIMDDELTFSYLGYEKQTVVIKDRNNLTIKLMPDLKELGEVVVVGYGTLQKREVTTAISKVKGSDLNQVVNTSVSGALRGKSTGLRVFNTSGAPGQQASITIRGGSSINKSNEALVLIDGMPGAFSQVNPQDVESIEVLKDAASTAIYGSRASNGIVLITTKSGSKGKPIITINRSHGFQGASRTIDRLNAEQYLTIARPALARSPYANLLTTAHPAGTGNDANSSFSTQFLPAGQSVPAGWKQMPDPLDPTKTLIFEDNDLQNDIFKGGSIINTYIGVNGGTENGKYNLSLGYVEDNGYTPNRDWASLTLTSNTETNLSKKFKVRTNILLQRIASTPYASEPVIFSTGIHLAPTIRSVMEDGSIPPGRDASYRNPLYTIDNISNERMDYRIRGSLGLTYEITKGLFLKGEAFHNTDYNNREFFEKKNFYNSLRPAGFFGALNQTTQFDLTANYSKSINNKHNFSGLIGGSYLSFNLYNQSAQANGSSRDDITSLNASSLLVSSTSTREREVLNSAFGRVTYNYMQKYLLSFTLRADGSSKFAENNRWGYFPGASLAYVVSDEDFMKNINWLSLMKVRTSYGVTGNNAVGRYDYQGVFTSGSSYLLQSAFSPSAIPNPNLTWESTNQLDAGIELGFLKNRVNVVLDYYTKITNGLLFAENLPNTSGFGSIEKNIGRVKFWGYEGQIDARILDTKNLKWNVGGNISFNFNEVLTLPNNGNLRNRANGLTFVGDPEAAVGGIAEGESLYAVLGYKVSHILDTEEAAKAARFDDRARGYDPITKTYQTGRKIAGDYEWIDKNGDGQITPKDQYVLGSLVPTTTGGFNTSLKFKNWELYGLCDFALGHVIYDRQISWFNAMAINGSLTPTTDVLNAWKKPGDAANTKFARVDIEDNNANGQWNYTRTSDLNTYKGDYLTIREVKLSHNLANSLLKNKVFKTFQVYVTGQNLYSFSAYPGYVTEYSGAGRNLADGNFPLPRIYTVGLSASF